MKLYRLFTIFTLGLTLASCSDYLEQEPPSYLTPEGFFSSEDKVQAAANGLYNAVLPGHGNWSYGTYADDVNTDNQMNSYSDTKYGTGLWKTSNTNSNWSWTNIRNINFQLNTILEAYEAGEISGSETNIRQYIGEFYFMRAYAYFTLMKKFGDLPIVKVALNDNEAELVEASKREPHNEVARFILSDLDTAMTYMKPDFEKRHTRISYDAALIFKSRVALYEGSWLTYFAGTPFVAGGNGWPGAAKDYNANYSYPSGSVENEAKYFLTEAANAAETIAEKYKSSLLTNTGTIPQKEGDAENPYFNIWGSYDMSGTQEVILWREYSKSLSVVNCVEVAIQHSNYGSGVTRSMIESYLMKDGKPIYNSNYTYKDGSAAQVATDRDPRLTIFLKVPGQKNVFKNMSSTEDHYVEDEPLADITNKNAEDGYVTGYAIRKGGTFDKDLCGNGNSYNGCVVFRATEALLNYMEAEYMLTQNLNAGHIMEYWRTIREKAGFTGEAINPETTINATDMTKETLDWGAYSAGQLLSDKTLYNIRRERRCELLAEGLRDQDLKRWRAMDQMMTKPYHMEGIHLWNSDMEATYREGGYDLTCDGSSNATVSSPSLSEYYRPLEVNMTNNSYKDGWVWHMAHYLEPLPLRQFLLTASDYASVDQSPLYQNPYWPTTTDSSAEQ